MSGYQQGQALLNACAAGRGVIVMVEGETPQHDPFFYKRWFDARAREISFFPQNGWSKVVLAVTELRAQLPARPIFGIIDRDFADDAVLQTQATALPADGVFRTGLCTLENYLLVPSGWLRVVNLLYRNSPPVDWSSEADITKRIVDAYRRCVPLAAFNMTVAKEYERLPQDGISYKMHPDAVVAPEGELKTWGLSRSPPLPLEQVFLSNLQKIQSAPQSELEKWVTGKAALKVFLQSMPPKARVSHDHLVSLYLDGYPTPPSEIHALVTRIIDRGGQP
ncbi:DUF4435 domain-containing protein [Myxococcus sp. K38C18041901]|uniref:DUF4435 domain-containing protein n=1 Tax=Myxococcus guangdongensis TaxID=2906760 RepID=UPI0020A75190|nr:DUF4435 domain-containing protein [Myxococcus guangdongensis]MCP3059786.1 DUF4435 domain-containing protein [Myxococcus guangdongensis]